jgi:alkylhydroperoxidase family enzyme
MYLADFVPRMRAGLEALGVGAQYLGWTRGPIEWDHATDPSDVVFNDFLPAVGAMRALDPVTSELVRLRGAAQHNCRLCKSVREGTALDAGGSESLYDDIAQFESSTLIDDRAKAALRYADGLIWTPAHLDADVVAEVRARFSEVEAVELTFDIMRNASNKVAVSLGGDAPRVESGTEHYLLDVDGQTVFS